MKRKNFWVAFGVILFFVVLVLWVFSQTRETPLQVKQEILTKVIPGEWMKKNPKSMESLADQIIKDHEKLAESFEKRDFEAMAKLYVKRGGAIISQEYRVISCKDIAKFWEEAWKEGSKLEFKTVHIYLSDKFGQQPRLLVEGGKEIRTTFDAVAFEIHEFRIIPKEEGVHNQSGEGTGDYAHQGVCTWGDGGEQ